MSQDGGAQSHGRYTGQSLAGGRYQLRDLLGQGGMASVHLAYDTVLDRQVAIKTLHTELGREQAFRERFRREAQAVAKLAHTNIVSVFDTGEDVLGELTTPYIVMEYVEGRPLGSVLQADIDQQGAMPADRALKITADVLAALEISHEEGLVHRDIKPGNVMVTKRGVVKVMDFGIARAMQSGVTSMTQTGMVVGTPQYLSPEQALGRGVDARSDLYSVGIMLFQLVTGRLPFDADSPLAIAYAHVQEEPVPPSSINRSLPPAVDALIARALRKNPNERFPSAVAMRDECLRVMQSLQQVAPSIVPGTTPQSGAGVGSAVFPPVGQQTPPPANVHTPYQPPAPTPGPYGTQPPAYGYPHSGGYQQPQHGYSAPMATGPGYPTGPQTGGPAAPGGRPGDRGGRNKAVLIGAVAAVLVAGGVITSLMLPDDERTTTGGGGGSTASASADPAGQYKGPEKGKTVDPTKCSEPEEAYDDEDKIVIPDFRYKYWPSVQTCLQEGQWMYDVKDVPDATWGDDMVVRQFPAPGTEVDENDVEIELEISTGRPE
ncbi:protein kinase [Streptomyces sp. MJP52]|uniref:protein kinase domain-containing protein n=1 Tax=Streptomyces sp. MJP52 TaxID=2940555 RepID=UPI00247476F0|nr:protein kinase [Streptomyces sp. MJP52]MDH6225973.1 serine/threonine protein kinase [Streptomyces sp. MJP52]